MNVRAVTQIEHHRNMCIAHITDYRNKVFSDRSIYSQSEAMKHSLSVYRRARYLYLHENLRGQDLYLAVASSRQHVRREHWPHIETALVHDLEARAIELIERTMADTPWPRA